MNTIPILVCIFLFVLYNGYFCGASVPICITNCVQCKQMFGVYFHGRACGDACVSSNGKVTPDCNNPRTLGNYWKRLH